MTVPRDIACLIFHHFQGDLTDLEQDELQTWLNSDPQHRVFFEQLAENSGWEHDLAIWHRLNNTSKKSQDDQMLLTKVMEKVQAMEEPVQTRKVSALWWYAAAAILLCCFSIYFIVQQRQSDKKGQTLAYKNTEDIKPGKSGARLTLPDGTVIALKSDDQGIQMGEEIQYVNGDRLATTDLTNTKIADNTLLTLEVPVKNFYKIILSDGTQVWVNSGSKLHYPLRFEKNNRVVELEGEAYFEVAKLTSNNAVRGAKPTRIPFLVKTKGQLLEVLGTKFNVTAYPNIKTTKTTLLEGKVAVSAAGYPSKSVLLTPGKQSLFDGNAFQIKEVDVDQAIAWKDGLFYFDGEDAKEAFEQLGKWYDIDIQYIGKEPHVAFFGTIERNKSLKTVVEILQKSGVKLRLERKADRTRLMIEGE
ncbi:FecR family protein [Sphingobacterium sp. BIGb0165]|uniref:FecR family protein n=1 Tax=Sphingobacterium sp. BIGb0165 TaxID=2940615 RepID=UPI002166E5D1|nr:FecR family protein [Sphingobacterium sp. BIGb0165]MCS4229144.1 ferric-dicitrate binding protein FerR (iron transport regulator) [Sphingobacterium sp. BIGb0165]